MLNFLRQSQAKATIVLLAINAVLWVGQILPGSPLTGLLWFAPAYGISEPWRFITAGFVHSPTSPLHILLNAYSIFIFGNLLEPALGRARFIALYLISILGGSVAVMYLSPPLTPVVGASGAFFGLMAAYFVIQKQIGGSAQAIGLIVINLAFSFLIPGVSWQGHVGGLLAGGAVASLYLNTRRDNQKSAQAFGLVAIVIVFVLLAVYRSWNFIF